MSPPSCAAAAMSSSKWSDRTRMLRLIVIFATIGRGPCLRHRRLQPSPTAVGSPRRATLLLEPTRALHEIVQLIRHDQRTFVENRTVRVEQVRRGPAADIPLRRDGAARPL